MTTLHADSGRTAELANRFAVVGGETTTYLPPDTEVGPYLIGSMAREGVVFASARRVGAAISLITLGRWDEEGFLELRQVVGARLPDELAAWCEVASEIVVMTRQDDLLLRHALVVGGHVEAVMAAERAAVPLARSAGHARRLEESLLSLVRDDDGDDRACELLLREALDDRNPESWRRLLARGATDLSLVVGVWTSLRPDVPHADEV